MVLILNEGNPYVRCTSHIRESADTIVTMSGSIEHYEVFETISSTEFFHLKRARNTQTDRVCALKLLKRSKYESDALYSEQVGKMQLEFERQSQLDHRFVWPARHFAINANYTNKRLKRDIATYMEMDWCQRGSFFELYGAIGTPLDESLARTFFHQLIKAVLHCHQSGCVHWNIIPQSLLLDDSFRIKLAEFRSGDRIQRKSSTLPPEVLSCDVQSGPAVDLFSCGYVLFSWVFFEAPFFHADATDNHYRQLLQDQPRFWSRSKRLVPITDSLKSLITSMLAYDPTQRPTISEVKSHPWYLGETLNNEELVTRIESEILRCEKQKRRHCEKARRYIGVDGPKYRAMQSGSWSWSGSDGLSSVLPPVPPYVSSSWKSSQIFLNQPVKDVWNAARGILLATRLSNSLHDLKPFTLRVEKVTDTSEISYFVRLLDCSDETLCIDFSQETGNPFDFFQVFSEFKADLEKWIRED